MVNWKLKGEWTLTSQKYENYTTIPEEYLSFLVNASKFGCQKLAKSCMIKTPKCAVFLPVLQEGDLHWNLNSAYGCKIKFHKVSKILACLDQTNGFDHFGPGG